VSYCRRSEIKRAQIVLDRSQSGLYSTGAVIPAILDNLIVHAVIIKWLVSVVLRASDL